MSLRRESKAKTARGTSQFRCTCCKTTFVVGIPAVLASIPRPHDICIIIDIDPCFLPTTGVLADIRRGDGKRGLENSLASSTSKLCCHRTIDHNFRTS